MKAAKKLLASALVLMMAVGTGGGSLADDNEIMTAGGTGQSLVTIQSEALLDEEGNVVTDGEGNPVYAASSFCVTVPTTLALTITADGRVAVGRCKIVNESAGPVRVTNIELRAGAWGLAAYGDLSSEPVDSNKLGFRLTTGSDRVETTSESSRQTLKIKNAAAWTIRQNEMLDVELSATATAVSASIMKPVTAANLVFTIGWDTADE